MLIFVLLTYLYLSVTMICFLCSYYVIAIFATELEYVMWIHRCKICGTACSNWIVCALMLQHFCVIITSTGSTTKATTTNIEVCHAPESLHPSCYLGLVIILWVAITVYLVVQSFKSAPERIQLGQGGARSLTSESIFLTVSLGHSELAPPCSP